MNLGDKIPAAADTRNHAAKIQRRREGLPSFAAAAGIGATRIGVKWSITGHNGAALQKATIAGKTICAVDYYQPQHRLRGAPVWQAKAEQRGQ